MSENIQGTIYSQTMRMMNYEGLEALMYGTYKEIPKALR